MSFDIDKETYKNNLLFYTILKNLVKCKFNEKQLIELSIEIKKNNKKNFEEIKEVLMKLNTENEDYFNLINIFDKDTYIHWRDMIDISIDLLIKKNLIIEESKQYVAEQYKNELNTLDKLSLEYDMSQLEKPYGFRVISSLIIFALTHTSRKDKFLMKINKDLVNELNYKIINVTKKYKLNVNNMFMILVDESVNQSIKSDSGQSYEGRVKEILNMIGKNVKEHVHDKKIISVEYDFTFEFKGKLVGVGAKRTLRERYKQNLEKVKDLDVDLVLLFTLGLDLNEEKMNNILQKKGWYIIVAEEIYERKNYLKQNSRIISSKDILKEIKNVKF